MSKPSIKTRTAKSEPRKTGLTLVTVSRAASLDAALAAELAGTWLAANGCDWDTLCQALRDKAVRHGDALCVGLDVHVEATLGDVLRDGHVTPAAAPYTDGPEQTARAYMADPEAAYARVTAYYVDATGYVWTETAQAVR